MAAELASRPWAMAPGRLEGLARMAANGQFTSAVKRAAVPRASGVAIVPATGYVVQHPNLLTALGLGTACEAITARVRLALADDEVDAIVLDIDCDGGEIYGMTELAAELRAAAKVKPVVGIANSVAAGAGYWLGASCGSLYVTPGGEVGGVGMAMIHEDASAALAKAGVAVTLVSAGKYKVEGHPYGPLDSDAKAFMQASCDRYLSMMVGDIAAGRKTAAAKVRANFGQGRIVGAKDAKAAGMVDGVRTLAQVVDDLRRGSRSSSSRLAMQVALSRAERGV
ncbi:MAG: S49 family peptidase [Burkholderiaceae bacterium]